MQPRLLSGNLTFSRSFFNFVVVWRYRKDEREECLSRLKKRSIARALHTVLLMLLRFKKKKEKDGVAYVIGQELSPLLRFSSSGAGLSESAVECRHYRAARRGLAGLSTLLDESALACNLALSAGRLIPSPVDIGGLILA